MIYGPGGGFLSQRTTVPSILSYVQSFPFARRQLRPRGGSSYCVVENGGVKIQRKDGEMRGKSFHVYILEMFHLCFYCLLYCLVV